MIRFIAMLCAALLTLQGAPLLKESYGFTAPEVLSTTLFPELSDPFPLFTVPPGTDRYRVSAETLREAFEAHGVTLDTGKVRYVTFTRTSPVDTSALAREVAAYYREHYPTLSLRSLQVTPRVYTATLPKRYTLAIGDTSYRHDSGTFYISDVNGNKSFFDYRIDADITVLKTRGDLPRKAVLNALNTERVSVTLESLRTPPFTAGGDGSYRLRRPLREGEVILERHVEPAPLVTRDSAVLATLQSGNVLVQIRAVALQDGVLHDIIAIEKPDGQRLKAKVVGKNRVEIE